MYRNMTSSGELTPFPTYSMTMSPTLSFCATVTTANYTKCIPIYVQTINFEAFYASFINNQLALQSKWNDFTHDAIAVSAFSYGIASSIAVGHNQ